MLCVDLRMPRKLAEAAERDGREAWVATLPSTVAEVEAQWSLQVGEPFQPGGQTAWVAPARRADGGDVVLKVVWRHFEAEHEPDALRTWNGDGAVLVHDVDERDDTIVMLLERCIPGTTLAGLPEPEQDTVIAGLLRRLWVAPPPGHRFRSLQTMCDAWADDFERDWSPSTSPLDPGLVREGLTLLREASCVGGTYGVVVHRSPRGERARRGRREPWLVIDPKPYVGDLAYDTVQHMLNCERVHSDPAALVRRMADLLELDRERVRLWLFARSVEELLKWPELAAVARRLAP